MSNISNIASMQPGAVAVATDAEASGAEQSRQEEMLSESVAALGEKIVAALRTVFDPEIPVNIYDLGLIYKIDVKPPEPGIENAKADVHIDMTLTTPNCPVAGSMPGMVQRAVANVDEVNRVDVNLVWDPPWDKSQMSDEAKLQLNMF